MTNSPDTRTHQRQLMRWALALGLAMLWLSAGGCRLGVKEDPCLSSPGLPECLCRTAPEATRSECTRLCAADRRSQECLCAIDAGSASCLGFCDRNPGAKGCAPEPDPCPDQSADDLIRGAVVALSRGEWDDGRFQVQCALNKDPTHGRAHLLQRQLQLTPVEYFNTSRSTDYVVVPGDSLAVIAMRCLNNRDEFVALASFNNIVDPGDLTVGQRIRIPGTRSCIDADECLTEAIAKEQASDLDGAYSVLARGSCAYADSDEVRQQRVRLGRRLISEELHPRAASMSSSGDCRGAKAIWERILDIDEDDVHAKDFLRYSDC